MEYYTVCICKHIFFHFTFRIFWFFKNGKMHSHEKFSININFYTEKSWEVIYIILKSVLKVRPNKWEDSRV